MPSREDAIVKPATNPPSDPAHSAAFIFLHGLGGDAQSWQDLGDQFQKGNKLPYMQWIFPNATENRDAMTTAWYTPSSLAAPPQGRPELAEDEDEDGMLQSVKYIEGLLDEVTSKGVPSHRIILGGFSQGCAMSLLTELVSSKYSGKLAGIVGLMGYLPIPGRIQQLRAEGELPHVLGETPIFLTRGTADRAIPTSKWQESVEKLKALGASEDGAMAVHEYQGLGHDVNPSLLKNLNVWLEKVVPSLG